MISEAILCAALALPAHPKTEYKLLRDLIVSMKPGYDVVFINDSEKLLNKGAERTPFVFIMKDAGMQRIRVWTIDRSA